MVDTHGQVVFTLSPRFTRGLALGVVHSVDTYMSLIYFNRNFSLANSFNFERCEEDNGCSNG
jgi:hypothetical protein